MEVIEHIVNQKNSSDIFKLWCLGDIHRGNSGHDRNALMKDVEAIKNDPNALWIGLGDFIDAVVTSDSKRFDPKAIAPEFLPYLDDLAPKQVESIKNDLECIRDKCIGLHDGNHEESMRKYHHYDLINAWCADWGVPHLKNVAFTRLIFRHKTISNSFIIFSAHSKIAGRSDGGKINRIVDLANYFEADIYMVGHGHRKVHSQPVLLGCTSKGEPKITGVTKIALMTGAYLRTYQQSIETYGEPQLYAPTELGALRVVIRPLNKELWVEG